MYEICCDVTFLVFKNKTKQKPNLFHLISCWKRLVSECSPSVIFFKKRCVFFSIRLNCAHVLFFFLFKLPHRNSLKRVVDSVFPPKEPRKSLLEFFFIFFIYKLCLLFAVSKAIRFMACYYPLGAGK